MRSETDQITWIPTQQGRHPGSGYISYKNGRKHDIDIQFVDPMENKMYVTNVCRRLCSDVVAGRITADEINVATIDERFASELSCTVDPDLAFYFGPFCCTYGLSPWQIRLTEFVQIDGRRRYIGVDSFLKGLYTYAKCEQRFGK